MFLIPEAYWEVKQTEHKGQGVFCKKNIQPGTVIGDYIGTVYRTTELDLTEKEKNLYLLYYHDEASIYPDLTKPGVHLCNHSCAPNCWMYVYKGHTLFFALRHIFAGEELTVSYLLTPQTGYCRSCTHQCVCGHIICTGTMHLSQKRYDVWNAFRVKEEKQTKRARVSYGKLLKVLDAYPTSISDKAVYTLFGNGDVKPLPMTHLQLPSIEELRANIRTSGRRLYFSNCEIIVDGVIDGYIVAEKSPRGTSPTEE